MTTKTIVNAAAGQSTDNDDGGLPQTGRVAADEFGPRGREATAAARLSREL